MIESLELRDFKSFSHAKIPLAPLTFLVGPNASGKSNVLDALRLLQGLSLALGIGEALNGKPGVWSGVRGGSQEAARVGTQELTVASKWLLRASPGRDPEGPEQTPPTRVSHALTVRTLPDVSIVSDLFGQDDRARDAYGWSDDTRVYGRSVVGPAVLLRADDRRNDAWALRHAVAGLAPLDPRPDALRGFSPTASTTVGEHGEGLIPELYRLLQREPGRRVDLVDWLSELCAPKLVDIDFVEVKEAGDVMLVLVEDAARRITSRSASDGTLRFLALIAALWVERADGVLFMEEPDLGLHPARQGLLAELFETQSSHAQIVATTHSPSLLARLSEDALANVIAFDRDPSSGASRAMRIGDLRHFDVLAKSRDVGHLFATGWLERAL